MSLLDLLCSNLDGDAVQQIGRRVGASPDATASAISAALPVLIGALSRNAANPTGAAALDRALDRDHSGFGLDDLGSLVSGLNPSAGQDILKHVLGGRQAGVENTIGRASGLDVGQVGQILAFLAPIVMGFLGRQKRQQGLDAGGLGGYLGAQAGQQGSPIFDLATRMLDADGDGSMLDDLAQMGGGLFGKMMGGR